MDLLHQVVERFESHRDDQNAEAMAKYMKNHFEFIGIKKPIRAELQKPFMAELMRCTWEEQLYFAKELWAMEHREYQYFSMELLFKVKKNWNESHLAFFEQMIIEKSWWDSVDTIATKLIGTYLSNKQGLAKQMMKSYSTDPNMWKRRTSIIFQLNYKTKTDLPLLFSNILNNLHDKQFFIQKAIGWALRQYTRTDANTVRTFVEKHKVEGLAKREALRLID